MELRQISYFIQLYKDLNITKAAQNLFISQQGLSKAIINLEKEIGFELFERRASGVKATSSANALYPYFKKVIDSYNLLLTETETLRQNYPLRIAAPNGFSMSCDKDDFMLYTQMYPDYPTIYTEYETHHLIDVLIQGSADVGFLPEPVPKHLTSAVPVYKEPFYAVVSSAHPLAKKDFLSLDDISGRDILLLDYYDNANHLILDNLNLKNISYRIYKHCNINEFLLFLSPGLLMGFSGKSLFLHHSYDGITFIPILKEDGSCATVTTHLVIREDASITPAMQHYIDFEQETHPRLKQLD